MVWTEFDDMHSGGYLKTDYEHIYVNLPRERAIEWFKEKFGIDPEDAACPCWGENFEIEEFDDLEEHTRYARGFSDWSPQKKKISLEEYEKKDNVLIVRE